MATRKSKATKVTAEKPTMIKIAEKVGEIAGRIVNEKEHLTSMATGAIDSVKSTLNKITAPKKKIAKKAKKVVKKAASKSANKSANKIVKKAAVVKKKVKKAAKKVVKKAKRKI